MLQSAESKRDNFLFENNLQWLERIDCNPYNCTTPIIRIKIVPVAMNHRRFFFNPEMTS